MSDHKGVVVNNNQPKAISMKYMTCRKKKSIIFIDFLSSDTAKAIIMDRWKS